MKRMFLSILLGLTGMALYAQNTGATCRKAIPLTKDYSETITKAGIEKWYSAQTFDLPLAVAFVPDDGESAPAPVVEMDFSCTSGYYEDSILCSLFCKTSGGSGIQIEMPYVQTLEKGKKDGKFAYTLSLGKRYRDLLLQMGISYNLAVYVKVKYNSTGVLTMLPDDFTNCMDGPKFMHFGDTVQVAAKDKKRHVIVPYVQWQEDTVVYTWNGTAPCRLGVAYVCDFDPTDDKNYGDIMVQSPDMQPGTSVKAKAENISNWVHNKDFPPQAGMYFAKFYSEEPGVMKITKAPQAKPDGDATMLRFGMTYALDANPKTIYAIPRSWNINVMLSSPTSHLFSMDISTTAKFEEGDILKSYSFEKTDNGRWIGILANEMEAHWNKVPTANHYLYIRFACTEATTITPDRWSVSDCYTKTVERTVSPAETKTIKKQSKDVYRFSYPQWIGGDMYIEYTLSAGNGDCDIYFANTCGMNIDKADADYWLKYQATTSTYDDEPLVIPATEIASWADKIDEEGNFYAIFYAYSNGTRKLTFTTNAPPEKDPEYPKSTIFVSCSGLEPYFEVSEAQTIVVKDENNNPQKNISAEPKQKYSLSDLPAGKYTLEGKTEKIAIKL
ncbi:MAG: hypothetical protein IKS76_00890 [Paludibacteraceae bacterium]|nr:hypothetical protein [Paludibacteraceae bacterium]MBR6492645.1 hypothetical protein [Paludibacteraceae bacterium]